MAELDKNLRHVELQMEKPQTQSKQKSQSKVRDNWLH